MFGTMLRFFHPRLAGFHRDGHYRGEGTFAALREDVALLQAAARRGNRRAKWQAWAAAAALVAGGLGASNERRSDDMLPWIAGGVVLALVLFKTRRWHRGRRNDRLGVAASTLDHLEIAPDAPVRLRVDLGRSMTRKKRLSNEHGVKVFADPWFELHAPLADGGHLDLALTEETVERSTQGMGASRAWFKTEWSSEHRIAITARLPAGATLPSDLADELRLPGAQPDYRPRPGELRGTDQPPTVEAAEASGAEAKVTLHVGDWQRVSAFPTPMDLVLSVLEQVHALAGKAAPVRKERADVPQKKLAVIDPMALATALMRLGILLLIGFAGLVVYALATSPDRLVEDEDTRLFALAAVLPFVIGWGGRRIIRSVAAARTAAPA